MDQNMFNNTLSKLTEEMQEIKDQLKQKGNTQIQYSIVEFKQLIETGQIPKELGEWYLKKIDERELQFSEWKKFIANNPNMSQEAKATHYYGFPKTLNPEEALKNFEDAIKEGRIHCLIVAAMQNNTTNSSETHDLPSEFFSSVENDEFGMSRLIADPINNLHSMLEKFTNPILVNDDDDIYIIQAEGTNTNKDKIGLQYRFRAPNDEEANKLAQEYIKRLTGKLKKMHETCWAMANLKQNRMISCDLTDLLMIAYPNSKDKNSFSIEQKLTFFQDFLDLSQAQITIEKAHVKTRSYKKKTTKTQTKNHIDRFILPFITILKTSNYNLASTKKSERYPKNITFSVLHNTLYEQDSMYNVGAGIKHKTLELRQEDIALAEWIQIRKSQLMEKEYITIKDKDFLFKLANVDRIQHSGMANKRLLDKLKRLKEKKIILNYPNRVIFPFHIKIRSTSIKVLHDSDKSVT